MVLIRFSLDEATVLVEAGFEYVTEMDGAKIFKEEIGESSQSRFCVHSYHRRLTHEDFHVHNWGIMQY